MVEREAWEAWDRSKKTAQEANVRDNDPNRGTKRIKSRHGDMRCLEIILKCGDGRRELLGLNPQKAQVAIQAENVQIVDQSELRRQLLYEPNYLEYLRQRAVDSDSSALCPAGQSRAVDANPPPRLPQPGAT